MEFFEVLRRRGSYRGRFEACPIPKETLEDIINAGIAAPSGLNYQTTSFVVVSNPALKKRLAEVISTPAMETAAAVIVPLSEPHPSPSGLSFETEDYAAAVENILLAITAKGYAAVWIDGQIKQNGAAERVAAILEIPKGKRVRAFIPVGKPLERVTQNAKKPLDERAVFLE